MSDTTRRILGVFICLVGAVLALALKQPGWVFLIVAGIVVYHKGSLPKPHQ